MKTIEPKSIQLVPLLADPLVPGKTALKSRSASVKCTTNRAKSAQWNCWFLQTWASVLLLLWWSVPALGITPTPYRCVDLPGGNGSWPVHPFGDINGDGYSDFLAYLSYGVRVLSGRELYNTGTVVELVSIPSYVMNCDPVTLGDLNGDGYDDYALLLRDNFYGRVDIYLGPSGSFLYSMGPSPHVPQAGFGAPVYLMGDVDGDGTNDIVTSQYVGGGTSSVQVRSGQNGSILYNWDQQVPGSSGKVIRVWPPGDIDGDGCKDVVACWKSNTTAFTVCARSPRSGATLFEKTVTLPAGCSLDSGTAEGDVDGDGRNDIGLFIAGCAPPQRMEFYSGATGALLYGYTPAILNVGCNSGDLRFTADVDGDGIREFFVPSAGSSLRWKSGVDGTDLAVWMEESGESAGNGMVFSLPSGESMFACSVRGNGRPSKVCWFTLDQDGDGLLDVWETSGLDVNGDGTVDLDLPAMGASSEHKDVFLELDSMSGYELPTRAIELVQDAFACAPLSNPDLNSGIHLHVDASESNLPIDDCWEYDVDTGGAAGPDWISAMDTFYDLYFGSAADRASGNWDAIRNARSRVFRYAASARKLSKNGCDGGSDLNPLGVALLGGTKIVIGAWPRLALPDGLPADDPYRMRVCTDAVECSVKEAVFAHTLIHELGHTLGLLHGGDDNINLKPNYYSVMNYTWAPAEWMGFGSLTWNMCEWLRLDYSRDPAPTLNETALDEQAGVMGPPAVLHGYPGFIPGGVKRKALTNGAIDWNANASHDAGFVFSPIHYLGQSDESYPPGLYALKAQDDWEKVFLAPNGRGRNGFSIESTGDEEPTSQGMRDLETNVEEDQVSGVEDARAGNLHDDIRVEGMPNRVGAVAIWFATRQHEHVLLTVYDVAGRKLRVLVDEDLEPGEHERMWDGKDGSGTSMPSGVYFFRQTINGRVNAAKAILGR